MHRPSDIEVKLRQQDVLREAEYRRWASNARRTERASRIVRMLGLRTPVVAL